MLFQSFFFSILSYLLSSALFSAKTASIPLLVVCRPRIFNSLMEKRKPEWKQKDRESSSSAGVNSDDYNQRSQTEPPSTCEMLQRRVEPCQPFLQYQHPRPMTSIYVGSLVTNRRYRKTKKSKDQTMRQDVTTPTLRRGNDLRVIKRVVKITDLVRLFLDKVRFNSVERAAVEYDPLESQTSVSNNQLFCHLPRITLPRTFSNLLAVVRVLFIVVYFFAIPLSLLFSELTHSLPLLVLKIISLLLGVFDLIEIFAPSQTEQHRGLILRQLCLLAATAVSIGLAGSGGEWLFLAVMANLGGYLGRVAELQERAFTGRWQKYWQLAKVLCLNLLVCHVLACVLIMVGRVHPQSGWLAVAGVESAPWYQQYIWSYYFGTTIILTIGFGDLHPGNFLQAFFIIFISFFACVFFGYNINCIGNLINAIRQEELEMNSKLRLLRSLARKTKLSRPVYHEISNFIVQESRINQESNHAQEKQLLQQLPNSLRSAFLTEANQKLFNHLKKLVPFTNKTVERLALSIEARLCHPQQTIKRLRDRPSLIILQSGEVGFVAKLKDSKLNDLVLQRISCSFGQQSKLVCADLLSGEPASYEIKSLGYSSIYEMGVESFESSVALCQQDYELYREVLDRCRYKLNEFGLVLCRFCENKSHSLFECPRLHYMPFRHTFPIKSYHRHAESQHRLKYIRNKKTMDFVFALDHDSKIVTEQHISCNSLADNSSPIACPRSVRPRKQKTSTRTRNSRQSYLLTMQMVTQLRQDIKRLKRQSLPAKFQFTLWQIFCDQGTNYKYYFPRGNPNNLADKIVKDTLILCTRNLKRKPKKTQDI